MKKEGKSKWVLKLIGSFGNLNEGWSYIVSARSETITTSIYQNYNKIFIEELIDSPIMPGPRKYTEPGVSVIMPHQSIITIKNLDEIREADEIAYKNTLKKALDSFSKNYEIIDQTPKMLQLKLNLK